MGSGDDAAANDTPRSGEELMRQFLPVSPYLGHLGIQLQSIAPGEAILLMPFSESLVTIGSTVHGGAIASLIDTAAMVAAWSAAPAPEKVRGATASMSISYLEPAQHTNLYATARVLRQGLSLVNLDVEVRNVSGLLIAAGLVTYKMG